MRRIALAALVSLMVVPGSLQSQAQPGAKKKDKSDEARVPHDAAPIYGATSVLQLTITANFRQLRRDKGQEPPWRGATISYADSTGNAATVPVRLRTRGIWRLAHCEFPPLRMNFVKEDVKGTLFTKLDKPKLVVHCRNNDEYEQYLLQEFQLYRIYNLLTPYSHRVRLARVTYLDSGATQPLATRYAFISESPDDLASRVGGIELEQQGAGPGDLQQEELALFSMFQYFIGNTDWSIPGLHNVVIVAADTAYVPVAYDFDFAGAVDARYATTDPRLPIRKVRVRLYRGFCVNPALHQAAADRFLERKDAIYALYRDEVGALMRPDRVAATLEYFDEFYDVIKDARRMKREITEQCIARP